MGAPHKDDSRMQKQSMTAGVRVLGIKRVCKGRYLSNQRRKGIKNFHLDILVPLFESSN